jgi:hypothetical protein
MALLDDIRNHVAVMNPGQRERRTAVLLREAAAEIERLRSIMASESYSPQAIERTPGPPSTPDEGTRQGECTLTDAEREAVAWFAEAGKPLALLTRSHNREEYRATLRGLLERTR